MCPHATIHVSSCYYLCVLILFAYESNAKFRSSQLLYVSSYCYICVLILLHMCPRTTMYLSSAINRNARHAIGHYDCAAIHTCGPFLSTLLLLFRILYRTCFCKTKKGKANIQKFSLTHAPHQRWACGLPLQKKTPFSKSFPSILLCHTLTQWNTNNLSPPAECR